MPDGFNSVVIGASGSLGTAIADCLSRLDNCKYVERISRNTTPGFDLTNEASISKLAKNLKGALQTVHLIFDATGVLSIDTNGPEKSIAKLEAGVMARAFAINAIGPALLMKHMTSLLPNEGKGVFATLSARVGSIEDNALGGWYSYRASKAALNQIVRTAALEVTRKRPGSVCIALHPGTVASRLSKPFAGGRFTHTPGDAAINLLKVVDRTGPEQSGSFIDYSGSQIPW